jgi:uncharacterized protein (TIGR03118 family)
MSVRRLLVATLVAAGIGGATTAVLQARSGVSFSLTRLVVSDTGLVNAWGLAASATGPWWVSNEALDTSTLYAADGKKQALTVKVDGGPTGVAYYGGRGFLVHANGRSGPARFIYACEDGTIRAWSPTVPSGWSKEAVVAVPVGGDVAIYRGVAVSNGKLYATDFHNGRVVVFDSKWRKVVRRGAFVDRSIPAWYAPFGIAAFGDRVFVTYAWRAPVDGNDAPTGGYVDEFDLNGKLVAHVARTERLNEPWGVALAPKGFGNLGGALLVANFGSGKIDAYGRQGSGWTFRRTLPVRVPGVWGIAFATGGMSGAKTSLFYAAGPHKWKGASEIGVRGELGMISASG